jgi:hypothetical protein
MATLPAVNYMTDSARTEGEFKASLEALLAATKQIPGAGVAELSYTIAGGSITPAGSGGVLVLDTESSAASDDLTNIVTTNYPDSSCLLLRNTNAARTVIVKHAATGAGQIFLERNADYYLDDTKNRLLLQRRGSDWYEIMRNPPRLAMPGADKSSSFTATRGDIGKVYVLDGGGITVSFEAVATLGNGWNCTFVNANSAANTVTLDPSGLETIDRKTTLDLRPQETITVWCDGTEMFSLNGYYLPKIQPINYAASLTINPYSGDYFEVTALTGNVTTLTVDPYVSGSRVRIRFVQDATGGRTVAAPSGAKIAGSLASAANQASVLDLTRSPSGNRWEGFWTQIPV